MGYINETANYDINERGAWYTMQDESFIGSSMIENLKFGTQSLKGTHAYNGFTVDPTADAIYLDNDAWGVFNTYASFTANFKKNSDGFYQKAGLCSETILDNSGNFKDMVMEYKSKVANIKFYEDTVDSEGNNQCIMKVKNYDGVELKYYLILGKPFTDDNYVAVDLDNQ